ncbi:hypothetical protein [Arthrobacter tecti]
MQPVEFAAKQGKFIKLVGVSSVGTSVHGGADELNVWGTPVGG